MGNYKLNQNELNVITIMKTIIKMTIIPILIYRVNAVLIKVPMRSFL
jgi:hypothetical protein